MAEWPFLSPFPLTPKSSAGATMLMDVCVKTEKEAKCLCLFPCCVKERHCCRPGGRMTRWTSASGNQQKPYGCAGTSTRYGMRECETTGSVIHSCSMYTSVDQHRMTQRELKHTLSL